MFAQNVLKKPARIKFNQTLLKYSFRATKHIIVLRFIVYVTEKSM